MTALFGWAAFWAVVGACIGAVIWAMDRSDL